MDTRLQWFESLYDSYADAIFRYLYAKLGDRERSKELTQDVFMKTWQFVMLDKTIEHEKAFLYRIAHNLFINEIRTNRKKVSLEVLTETGFELSDAHATAEVHGEHTELMDKLSQIKDSYRTVLTMRYIDDLAVKDIALILEESETNISMRINRALQKLKETYYTNPVFYENRT